MELARTIASDFGKPEHGMLGGSVWNNTKAITNTANKQLPKKTKNKEDKRSKKGPCVMYNSGQQCKAAAQGRECPFAHTCSAMVSGGPRGLCGKDHAAKDHPYP